MLLITAGAVAVSKKIPAVEFEKVIVQFFDSGATEAYNEASDSGNVKLVNIQHQELQNVLHVKKEHIQM